MREARVMRLVLLFKGFLLFGFFIFQFKNAHTPLCLSKNKTKGHFVKNVTLTPTKTLSKKQDYSPVNFQITLSTYKLDSFFKKKKKLINQILKIKTLFFCQKKKVSPHLYYYLRGFPCLDSSFFLYYYLRGFPCLDSSFFSSKMSLHLYV